MAQIEVLNPVASSVEYKVSPAKRLDSLAGKTIGLYWNIKAGGDVALAHISERLKSRIPGLQFKNYIGPVGAGTRRLTA
jgi:hypothetical protein